MNHSTLIRGFLKPLALLTLTLALGACKGEVGEKNNPVQLWIVPSHDAEATQAAAEKLAAHLAKETGLEFHVEVPEEYIDLVAALADEEADLLFMNDLSYLLAHEKYEAHAAFAVERSEGEEGYRAEIIAHKDSGIESLKDLNGKRIAIVDLYSVSGYLLPAAMLQKEDIKPCELITAGGHDTVVQQVLEREVDAGFTFTHGGEQDGRRLVKESHPEVFEVVKVIATTDRVPNEPVVFGAHVKDDVRKKISAALLDYSKTEEGKAVLLQLQSISGLREVDDHEYDPVREALLQLGEEVNAKIPGGGLLDLKEKEGAVPMPPLGD